MRFGAVVKYADFIAAVAKQHFIRQSMPAHAQTLLPDDRD